MSRHEILLIGGGPAALTTAHTLLKTSIPKASKATGKSYRLTMLSASADFWFTVGTVRAVVSPQNFPQDKIRVNIRDNFPKFPAEQFRFIHGAATSVDFKTRNVGFTPRDVADAPKEQNLSYDSLIIASGSHHSSNVWKLNENQDLEASSVALRDMHEKIAAAKTIVIAGGGPVSIETSGEIMTWFTGIDAKDVTIVTAADKVLATLKHPDIPELAMQRLKSQGVKVRTNSKVEKTEKGEDGKYTITFSNGDVLRADLYIDATGVHPNSSFLPDNVKDTRGWVNTDAHFNVTAAGPEVFAVGDIVSFSKRTFVEILDGAPVVTESWLHHVAPNAVKGEGKKFVERAYDMIVVPIGKKTGVGALFGWKLWPFFVWLIKGRTMMLERVPKYVTG